MDALYIDFGKRLRESRWRMPAYIAVGIIVIADGIYQVMQDRGPFFHAVGITLIVIGPLYLYLVWMTPRWKTFFKVDDDSIEFKLQFAKLRRFDWQDISSVEVMQGRIALKMSDGRTEMIQLGAFGRNDRLQIRNTISEFGQMKGLLVKE